MDRAGRLLEYPGKIEVRCPDQGPGTAVILIAGQSNAANSGAERHTTRYPDRVLNFVAGRCFVAASPLLGSNGFAGEYWTPLADQLIESGAFDRVILAPVAVGGSRVAQWASGGELNATMKPLVAALVLRYRVTHVLWHQGESDFMLRTSADAYRKAFLSFAASLRSQGVEAPIYVSKATRCGPGWKIPNPVRTAQQQLADTRSGLKSGVDTDLLLESEDRCDDCHFSESGEMKAAKAWAELLLPPARAAQLKQASDGDDHGASLRSGGRANRRRLPSRVEGAASAPAARALGWRIAMIPSGERVSPLPLRESTRVRGSRRQARFIKAPDGAGPLIRRFAPPSPTRAGGAPGKPSQAVGNNSSTASSRPGGSRRRTPSLKIRVSMTSPWPRL